MIKMSNANIEAPEAYQVDTSSIGSTSGSPKLLKHGEFNSLSRSGSPVNEANGKSSKESMKWALPQNEFVVLRKKLELELRNMATLIFKQAQKNVKKVK